MPLTLSIENNRAIKNSHTRKNLIKFLLTKNISMYHHQLTQKIKSLKINAKKVNGRNFTQGQNQFNVRENFSENSIGTC